MTAKTTRRIYTATSNTGVVETYTTVRADREYNWAVVVERREVIERRRVEVPTTRFFRGDWIPHMCYRDEVNFGQNADGNGECVVSFHTTEELARRNLPAGPDIFNAYIVRTVRTK